MSRTKASHELAISHIVLATQEAQKGNAFRAKSHVSQAKKFADTHVNGLKMVGMHDEANKYLKAFQDHVKRVETLLNTKAAKKSECSEDHSLVKTCTKCGYMNKSDDLDKIEPKMQIKSPGQDPRYKYKAIHELSSEDQARAYHKFQNKEMGRYLYPVDESGTLVHGTRAPMPKDKIIAPKPLSAEYQQLKPHHLRDSAVRINAPGHPAHGKLGIVQGSNPMQGGKIEVKMGTGSSQVAHFHPDQVQPSRPTNKIEKALVAYWSIQKALLKA
jgi:hypothetical protein